MSSEYDRYVKENQAWMTSTVETITAVLADSEDSPEYAASLPRKVDNALQVCLQHALEREPDDSWSYGVCDDIVVAVMRRSEGPTLMDVHAAQLHALSTLPVPESWPSFGPSVQVSGGVVSIDFGSPIIDCGPAG